MIGPIFTELEKQELATCLAFEKPFVEIRDASGRLHNVAGPAVIFNGDVLESKRKIEIYCVRNILVDSKYFKNEIDINLVLSLRNDEERAVLIDIMSPGKFAEKMGAKVIHEDVDNLGNPRQLLQYMFEGSLITAVKVINSTAEPDGTYKTYYKTVHPELRPLYKNHVTGKISYGDSQELTCHNAVASTFSKYGYEYHPDIET